MSRSSACVMPPALASSTPYFAYSVCTPCVEGRLRATPHSSSLAPATVPLQMDSGVAATRGACPGGTGSGGANIGCADTGSAGARGAGVGGAGSRGYSTGGAGSRGAGVGGASSGGAAAATPAPGVPCYLSRFQLHYQQQLRSSLPLVSGLRLLGLPSLLPGHSLPLPEYGPPFSPLDVSLARSPPWSLQSPLLPPSPSRLTSSWTTRPDLQQWASWSTRVVDLRGGHCIGADFWVPTLGWSTWWSTEEGPTSTSTGGDIEQHVAGLKGADFGTSTWRRQPGEGDVGGKLTGVLADLELADQE
ncbi:unnamed protein product [Closterium sp. NIES-54]